MSITAKPFAIADKIVKRIFLGKPAIYADVDINQAISVDEYAFNGITDRLGSYTESFVPTTPTFTQTATHLEFEVAFAGGGKLFAKKTVFDIPAFDFTRLGGSKIDISTRTAAICNFWLIAKKNTITFAMDNAVGGINGSGFSGPVPSSNAVTYSDERVDMTIGVDVAPTLGTDEEVIELLCQIAYKEDLSNSPVSGGSIAFLQVLCPDVTTINDRVFPDSEDYFSSVTKSVYSNLMKLSDYVKAKTANAAQKNGYVDISNSVSAVSPFTATTKVVRQYHDGTVAVYCKFSFSGSVPVVTQVLSGLPGSFGKLWFAAQYGVNDIQADSMVITHFLVTGGSIYTGVDAIPSGTGFLQFTLFYKTN